MTRFLIVFLSVYSLMHALFYFRIRTLLPDGKLPHILLILFLIMMILAPIAARMLETRDYYFMARIAAYLGYPWMGIIFYAFLLFTATGIAGLVLRVVNFIAGTHLPVLNGSAPTLCVLLAVLAINIYGLYEASDLRVERLSFKTSKLPEGTARVRIAQISDVHLGLLAGDGKMRKVLDKVALEDPDILVSTGDLVDGNMDRIGDLPEVFSSINPRLGKYAITGNHEVYAGLPQSVKAEEAFGFTLLRGEVATVGGVINLVGVDDPAAAVAEDETAILKKARNGLFTVLLKHRPDPFRESLGFFDLQLSGHTHYGQLFPFRLFGQLFYPLQNGPYFLDKGSILYTSRGSATWGPPIRVLAPPEITIIDILPAAKDGSN